MLWELSDLVGIADIASLYEVGRPTVSNWTVRYDGFPEPLVHIAGRPVYSRKQVQAWMAEMVASGWDRRRANPNMARTRSDHEA